MRRKAVSFAICLVASIGAHSASRADQLENIKAKGVLRCGVVANSVPFSQVDENRKQVGYDLDMCEEVAKSLGVKVENVIVAGSARIQDLIQDRIDISASAITITPARAEQVDFSQPYFRTGVVIGIPDSKPELKSLSALAGKRISVTEGGLSGQTVTEKVPNSRVIGFPTTASSFLALEQGKVDAMGGDETTLMGLISASKEKYVLLPDRLSDDALGLAVRKGEKGLLAAVNKTLTDIEKSGRAQEIFDTWFGSKSKLKMARSFRVDAQ